MMPYVSYWTKVGILILGSEADRVENQVNGEKSSETSLQEGTLWVEGLVPGIDFCNHGMAVIKNS